jgi:predicted ATPase
MGEVYAAHDSELDRKVALKLLRPDSSQTDPAVLRMRLMREAQAMARLSHPNVVSIYDVGTFKDHVFIAMEYVAGQTLRHWLRETARPWREVVSIFIEAGRGLAAAHAAQVLHRDFKPENVLVANDGRVRVLDFGLARANEREPSNENEIELAALTVSKAKILAMELSRSGAMVGTPAYMAPEQLLCQALDPRADQFSFCVSLYEALYGERPFAGENVSILMGEVIGGKVKTPRQRRRIPSDIRKALLRGLKPNPHARHSSMDALLTDLLECVSRINNDQRITNVEPPPKKFVGRLRELEQMEALLQQSGSRLLTLLGPGGVGKTRLATQFALAHLGRFSGRGKGGAWFCDLSEVRTLDGFLNAVAQVLRNAPTRHTSSRERVEQLGYALAARGPLLMVLDNFEQVVDLAAETVGTWIRMSPETRFLVTSRELLRIPGEQPFEVLPLELPQSESDTASIQSSDSVQLFLDRVRAVRGWSYAPSAPEAMAIAQIVRRLDGIPLAIELAAARMNVLSPAQMAEGLAKPLQLLTAGARGAQARQATLRGAIQWSWELLSPAERDALAQCSIFRGGFSLEAAEAVLSVAAVKAPPVLDLIQALREKSLLRTYQDNSSAAALRFGMYEAIRDFVAEQLRSSAEGAKVSDRHTRYYLQAAEGWHSLVHRHGGVEALRALAANSENLFAAFERECSHSPLAVEGASAALRLSVCLDPLLSTRGPVEAHQAILNAALSVSAGLPVQPSLRGRALRAHALLCQTRGITHDAARSFNEALVAARACLDSILEATLMVDLSILYREQGKMKESEEAIRTAAPKSADPWFQAYLHGNAGILDYELGRPESAEQHYATALTILREIGDRRFEGIFETNLGLLYRDQKRLPEARAHYEKGITALREVGDRRYEGTSLDCLASTLWEEGRYVEAKVYSQQACKMLQEAGDRRQSWIAVAHLAGLHASLDQIEEAEKMFASLKELTKDADDPVLRAEIELSHGHLDLAIARKATGPDGAELRRGAAQVRATVAGLGKAVLADSSDVRVAVRRLLAAADELAATARAAS